MAINRFGSPVAAQPANATADAANLRRRALMQAMGQKPPTPTPAITPMSVPGQGPPGQLPPTARAPAPGLGPTQGAPRAAPTPVQPGVASTPVTRTTAPAVTGAAAPGGAGNVTSLNSTAVTLAGIKTQQNQARSAQLAEQQKTKAEALLAARARMNLSGGGLSGASAAAEGDIAASQNATNALALQDTDQKNRDAQNQELQNIVNESDMEDADDTDYNGDGVVGYNSGDPTENAAHADDLRRSLVSDLRSDPNNVRDIGVGDADTPDGQGGTKEEPLVLSASEFAEMKKKGFAFGDGNGGSKPFVYELYGQQTQEWVDQYGNHYIVGASGSAAPAAKAATPGTNDTAYANGAGSRNIK